MPVEGDVEALRGGAARRRRGAPDAGALARRAHPDRLLRDRLPGDDLFVEGLYLRTGDATYKTLAKRWSKVALVLYGEAGRDQRNGGPGADRLAGGGGDDRITSVDTPRDSVECGPGRDAAIIDRRDRACGCERVLRSGR